MCSLRHHPPHVQAVWLKCSPTKIYWLAMSVDDRTPLIFDASRPSPNVMPAHCKGLTLANLTPAQAQHLSNAFRRRTNLHTSDAGMPSELVQSLLNNDNNKYACPLHTLSWACGPLLLALTAAFLTLSSPVCLPHPLLAP